jgi:integrase/recombinase XerD
MDRIRNYLDILRVDQTHSENTIQAYIGDLQRFRDYLETKYRSVLSGGGMAPWHFTEFLESENLSGFSANTLQRRKMVLAQFAQYLNSIGEFTSSQAEEILNWRITLWQDIYHQGVEFLSMDDVRALLGDEDMSGVFRTARDKAIFSILLETGLTISSVIDLRLDQLNLEVGALKLTPGSGFVHKIPKSVRYLEEYISEERLDLIQSASEEFLFISQLGGAISRQGVWQMLKSVGDRLDPPVKLAPRVLRNTAVKRMIEDGLTVAEIQQRLGHRNIYSTRALVRKIKRTQTKQEAEND